MASALRFFFELFLVLELQGKLHLPGRTGIARREARVGDNAKCRATDLRNAARLSKVRVIEQIENLPTEFDQLVLADFCPLD